MQGFQSDTTATDTECYGKVTTFNSKVTILSETLQAFGSGSGSDNPAEAIYNLSDITVASTDVFTYCQTTDLAKQLAIKFNSLAGFFDLLATIGVAYLKNYQDPTQENELYTAYETFMTSTDCASTCNNSGQMIHYALGYQVRDSFYVDQLGQNLVEDMF